MDEDDWRPAKSKPERGALRAVAYRMLGALPIIGGQQKPRRPDRNEP